jgi:hypothetical protein
MASIKYTAKRRLIPGHVIDNIYSIDFNVSELVPTSKPMGGNETISMGGQVSSVLGYVEESWTVETVPILYSELDEWKEWEHSVMNAEEFDFDGTGTSSSPDNVLKVRLQKNSFRVRRIGHLYMTISFRVIVNPT